VSQVVESVGIDALVHRIAGLLAHGGGVLTSGDVAALRRMDAARAQAPFFKLAGLVLDEYLSRTSLGRERAETRWAAIVVGLAHLGELHRQGIPLGRALVDAHYSELRFSRLLRADGDQLLDELPALARFLSAKGVGADWSGAAWLILSVGHAHEERTRRALARDYYRALGAQDRN